MPVDTTDIITNAIADLPEMEGGGDSGDTLDPVETPTDRPDASVSDEPAEGVVADTPAAEVVPEPVPEPPAALSEAEKMLADAGIKAPKAGERENRIPYSRTVKIIENALKKQTAGHTTALNEVQSKVQAYEGELATFRNADRLATQDPDRYMQMLATVNPAYKRFLQPAADAKPAAAATTAALGPAPGPDVKFSDGSLGYSPEQMQKREDWLVAKAQADAVAAVRAEYDKRLGPIEAERKAREAEAARLPEIQKTIAEVKDQWGDEFPKEGSAEEKAIVKLLNENPRMSFATAVSRVMVPKLRADREKQRMELLEEMKGREKAAAKGAPAAVKGVGDPNAPRSTEDIIRQAIAGIK